MNDGTLESALRHAQSARCASETSDIRSVRKDVAFLLNVRAERGARY